MLGLDEAILLAVASVPPGRTTSYKAIGAIVGCGPRHVAHVLSRHGRDVPWWRVVRSDRTIAAPVAAAAVPLLRREGVQVEAGRVAAETHLHHSA